MRACFKNAFNLLTVRDDLTYVEGYAFWFLPVLHAWCVDAAGNVVDPTWDDPQDRRYFGVPFDRDFVFATAKERERYGVIENPEMNFPLITRTGLSFRSSVFSRTMSPSP